MNQVEALEQAILDRAKEMAAECKLRAEHGRANILREASDRLQLREEKETLLAKALAERAYRRRVQADELKLQSRMDHLRWNLVQTVLQRIPERIQALRQEEPLYLELMGRLLARGAAMIEHDELIVEVNEEDHRLLQPIWETFSHNATPDKQLHLTSEPIRIQGGLRLHTPNNRIRLDQSFEGRLERLQRKIYQVIEENLLPHTSSGIRP
ncbi:Archaeal/vacuolar-type H+-ATPase subunit E/Vma4 [endosymbiont of Ridgeia piscesae]|jgi:V/A-type H+-transporting ATPase subunit E|uniref:V-type ATP synthase subunit E n=3 Tax=endosymbiont of Ridgeia piscesae TaxID=54398 RepID=A0A0T5YW81_9GAMM|nr:V-type ATP synthase subunit E family protein [endosymbiont of Ridgeia piscesae]KRT54900.1 Archaeal/vacuolar-type H+-ATPase subunit E/Vma4 [endosymbiont of Ridgeia piscesae]